MINCNKHKVIFYRNQPYWSYTRIYSLNYCILLSPLENHEADKFNL